MNGGDDRGIGDQSALRMREPTFAAGVWLTYVVCGAAALYIGLAWERARRLRIWLLFGSGLAGAAVISRLPRARIVRSRYREAFFFAWSVIDLALIVAAASADGGTNSPLALVLFVPVVFAAMSYPLASVVIVGGLSVASSLGLPLTAPAPPCTYPALFPPLPFFTAPI